MRLKIFLTVMLTLFWGTNILAQDSTKSKVHWGWEWDFDEFNEWIQSTEKLPTISLQYGFSNINHKDVSSEFIDPGLVELKLGYTARATSKYANYLSKYISQYLYISFISQDLSNQTTDTGKINSKTWRFGFSRSSGYGYKLGDAAVVPYFNSSLDWSRVNFINPEVNPDDLYRLNRFDKSFRFGTSNEGGIRIDATPLISIEAGYQRSIVFERHLFWKWAGSAIIELASQGLLDAFIREIFESSPAAGPVVYFLLKNALSYGLYELRQDKMNWPFSGAAPLSFDSFKFGATFTF